MYTLFVSVRSECLNCCDSPLRMADGVHPFIVVICPLFGSGRRQRLNRLLFRLSRPFTPIRTLTADRRQNLEIIAADPTAPVRNVNGRGERSGTAARVVAQCLHDHYTSVAVKSIDLVKFGNNYYIKTKKNVSHNSNSHFRIWFRNMTDRFWFFFALNSVPPATAAKAVCLAGTSKGQLFVFGVSTLPGPPAMPGQCRYAFSITPRVLIGRPNFSVNTVPSEIKESLIK